MSHSLLTKLGWIIWAFCLAIREPFIGFAQTVREYYWMLALETEKRIQNLKYQYPREWKAYNKQRMTAVANRTRPMPEECMDFSYYLFLLKTK